MPIPPGEMQKLLEEQRRREAAHRRIRRERRRRSFVWWLAAAAAATILFFAARLSYAANTLNEELGDRVRQLEARIQELEEDRERLARALLTFEVPAALDFAGEAVPLDQWDVRERLEREVLLSLQERGQLILWLKRAARYFPYTEEALRRAGLPDDLKYVAVIESALPPQALSRASALGIWQFIPATARRYGLRIPDEELYRPPPRDRWRVRVRQRLRVLAIAEASGSFYREVKQLNPAIPGDALPAGTFPLNLPEGQGEGFQARRTGLESPTARAVRHRVRRGETLWRIARRYGISLADLRQRNPGVRNGVIRPGDTLLIR
jgi:hypothetical protein